MTTTNPGALTAAQLRTIRRKLEDERHRILRVLGRSPPPDAAREDPEVEEAAQRATERTAEAGIADRERALLADVERALAKLDAGTYGASEKTGRPIPPERLLAIPWARDDVGE